MHAGTGSLQVASSPVGGGPKSQVPSLVPPFVHVSFLRANAVSYPRSQPLSDPVPIGPGALRLEPYPEVAPGEVVS